MDRVCEVRSRLDRLAFRTGLLMSNLVPSHRVDASNSLSSCAIISPRGLLMYCPFCVANRDCSEDVRVLTRPAVGESPGVGAEYPNP